MDIWKTRKVRNFRNVRISGMTLPKYGFREKADGHWLHLNGRSCTASTMLHDGNDRTKLKLDERKPHILFAGIPQSWSCNKFEALRLRHKCNVKTRALFPKSDTFSSQLETEKRYQSFPKIAFSNLSGSFYACWATTSDWSASSKYRSQLEGKKSWLGRER